MQDQILHVYRIRKQCEFCTCLLVFIHPLWQESYSHWEDTRKTNLERSLLLLPSYVESLWKLQRKCMEEPTPEPQTATSPGSSFQYKIVLFILLYLPSCSHFPCNTFLKATRREQRGNGHMPQGPSVKVYDAIRINASVQPRMYVLISLLFYIPQEI